MTHFEKEYQIGSWGKGLLLYGLLANYLYEKNEKVLDFVKKWIMHSVETQTADGELSGGDPSQVNFATIGLSLLFFAEAEPTNQKLIRSIRRQAEYFLKPSLKRTETGALYYMKGLPQVWIDTVIMVCPFLVQAGKFLGEEAFINEAIHQLEVHMEYLKDPETNLFRHIWDDKQKRFYEGSLWGRGNGWMLASLQLVAEQLPEKHPKRTKLIAEMRQLAESLILCQDETGFWRIYLDKISEESKIETAGTLIIAYGLSRAIRRGWLDPEFAEYVQGAFEAVINCVDEEGVVMKSSGPTIDPKHTPYDKPFPHTQGLFLMMTWEMTELLHFLRENELL